MSEDDIPYPTCRIKIEALPTEMGPCRYILAYCGQLFTSNAYGAAARRSLGHASEHV